MMAARIPLGALRKRMDELPQDKDTEVICYCKISLRGYEAAGLLTANGWTNVKVMEGGIMAWPWRLTTAIGMPAAVSANVGIANPGSPRPAARRSRSASASIEPIGTMLVRLKGRRHAPRSGCASV